MEDAKGSGSGRVREIVWVALVAVALAVPAALADDVGPASLNKDIAKALKQAKAAKKKAKRALVIARDASEQAGPQGLPGTDGQDGQDGRPGADGRDALATIMGGTRALGTGYTLLTGEHAPGAEYLRQLSPNHDIKLTELRVRASGQADGGEISAAVMLDGAPTALSCTVTPALECGSDEAVEVPALSELSMQVINSDQTGTHQTVSWSIAVEPG